jgi:glycosyltransferase involved in cell wall biosynthesis
VRVLAFTKYGREAASTRQRLLQYLPGLEDAGIAVHWRPLLSDSYVRSLAGNGKASRLEIGSAYIRRMWQIGEANGYDVIWIYAELFPWLPAGFERLAALFRRPIVYDWDDAFFVPYDEAPRPAVRRLLGGKLRPLMQAAAACTCGNAYLEAYASRFCRRTLVVPTVVDTDAYRPLASPPNAPLTIGWIGSPSTWDNVRPLLPLLADLARTRGVRVRIIGAGRGALADRFEGADFIDWSEDREIAEVQAMDIGVMPLIDAPFQRGKSGYKLVQYMACGLPVVASPVGVNSHIVEEGSSGFLARGEGEWRTALERLIEDAALRRRMGEAGRARAVAEFSLASQLPRLASLFRSIAQAV